MAMNLPMRFVRTILLGAFFVCGCGKPVDLPKPDARIQTAEAVIDAFYSFDPERLRAVLSEAPESTPRIVYYQGWAEGGNYTVVDRRPCRAENAEQISCSIKVKDDLIAALGTGYDVTDTFHLTFSDGKVIRVTTSSDDPPDFEEAQAWVQRERAELIDQPCVGFFKGGPTPQECVRAMVRGFSEFAEQRHRSR